MRMKYKNIHADPFPDFFSFSSPNRNAVKSKRALSFDEIHWFCNIMIEVSSAVGLIKVLKAATLRSKSLCVLCSFIRYWFPCNFDIDDG